MDGQSKYIKDLQGINKDMISAKRASIKEHKKEITALFNESKTLGKNLTSTMKTYEESIDSAQDGLSQLNSKDYSNKQIFGSQCKTEQRRSHHHQEPKWRR